MTELSSGTPLPLINTGSSCACCAPADTTATATGHAHGAADAGSAAAFPSGDAAEVTTVLQVTGMTCGHCVASVTEELGAIHGVSAVDVDLVPGGSSAVSVTSAAELDSAAVEAAVEEAGYSLAPSGR
jgi:copper chaperone